MSKRERRILFIGNSHTYYNDLPYTVSRLYQKLRPDEQATAVMLAHPGRTLGEHLKEPEVRFNILYGRYDWIVLQQAAHPFPGVDSLMEEGGALCSMIRMTSAQPIAYMTWAEERFPENQKTMTEAYQQFAAKHGLLIAPVGSAWNKMKEMRPELCLYDADGEHASVAGSFLAGLVFALLLSQTKLHDEIEAQLREEALGNGYTAMQFCDLLSAVKEVLPS